MKKIVAICALIALLLTFVACSPAEKTASGFSMGSDYYVNYLSSANLDSEIADLLSSIEESFSVRVENSVLSRINESKSGDIISLTKEETTLLSRAFMIAEESDAAFDPAVLPLVKVWGFDPPYEMNGEIPPSEEMIQRAKSLSSYTYFSLNRENATLSKSVEGAALDLGAAVKGYAVEKVRDFMVKKASEALVYIGGTIAAVGRDYAIGVTPPRESAESYAFRFTLKEGEICATSGDYERYYIYEGRRYHHILDGRTGRPAASGVISATVIGEDGLLADALATAVVVLGAEKGKALLEKYGVKGVLVTEEKKVIACGVEITIKDGSYVF